MLNNIIIQIIVKNYSGKTIMIIIRQYRFNVDISRVPNSIRMSGKEFDLNRISYFLWLTKTV